MDTSLDALLRRLRPQVDYLNLFDTVRIEYRSSKGSDGQREWSSKNVNP